MRRVETLFIITCRACAEVVYKKLITMSPTPCVFVLFSVCVALSNGQLNIPGLGDLGSTLQNALGGATGANPLSALTGAAAPGGNPLGNLGNTVQNPGNGGSGGLPDTVQSALNSIRDMIAQILQFKLQLYQMEQDYNGSEAPTTTPASSQGNSAAGLGNALSGAANALGGALSGATNALPNLGSALGNPLGALTGAANALGNLRG